jgi:ATP-dependent Clp protease ATP-binding subunit ClpB
MPTISSWDKLTSKAKEALQAANSVASRRGNRELMPIHLLASLLADREGTVVPLLSKIGVDHLAMLAEAEREIECLPAVWAGGALKAEPSWAASEVLGQAFEEAADLNDEHVSTEHLLLAIISLENDPAQALLTRHGAIRPAFLTVLVTTRGTRPSVSQPSPAHGGALELYARDLTELARRGKLDPVIGRDDEIWRVIQVLLRRTPGSEAVSRAQDRVDIYTRGKGTAAGERKRCELRCAAAKARCSAYGARPAGTKNPAPRDF